MCLFINKNNSNLSILIVDKGKPLEKRKCPASNNNKCCKCKICSITTGIAGAMGLIVAKHINKDIMK